MSDPTNLSRRERQVMEVVFTQGKASATDVLRLMPDPPTRAAVRTFLRILEAKGHLKHAVVGREFIYSPTVARQQAGRRAFRNVLSTFFGGSLENALATHLTEPGTQLTDKQVRSLRRLIEQAKQEGK